jgi:hypothetical protein
MRTSTHFNTRNLPTNQVPKPVGKPRTAVKNVHTSKKDSSDDWSWGPASKVDRSKEPIEVLRIYISKAAHYTNKEITIWLVGENKNEKFEHAKNVRGWKCKLTAKGLKHPSVKRFVKPTTLELSNACYDVISNITPVFMDPARSKRLTVSQLKHLAYEVKVNTISKAVAPLLNIEPDYFESYKLQKALTKREVLKLKPGTWVELKWRDSPNSIALLLERVTNSKGDVSIPMLHTAQAELFKPAHITYMDSNSTNEQIVSVHGSVDIPNLGNDDTIPFA